eukprot:gene7651-8491_t
MGTCEQLEYIDNQYQNALQQARMFLDERRMKLRQEVMQYRLKTETDIRLCIDRAIFKSRMQFHEKVYHARKRIRQTILELEQKYNHGQIEKYAEKETRKTREREKKETIFNKTKVLHKQEAEVYKVETEKRGINNFQIQLTPRGDNKDKKRDKTNADKLNPIFLERSFDNQSLAEKSLFSNLQESDEDTLEFDPPFAKESSEHERHFKVDAELNDVACHRSTGSSIIMKSVKDKTGRSHHHSSQDNDSESDETLDISDLEDHRLINDSVIRDNENIPSTANAISVTPEDRENETFERGNGNNKNQMCDEDNRIKTKENNMKNAVSLSYEGEAENFPGQKSKSLHILEGFSPRNPTRYRKFKAEREKKRRHRTSKVITKSAHFSGDHLSLPEPPVKSLGIQDADDVWVVTPIPAWVDLSPLVANTNENYPTKDQYKANKAHTFVFPQSNKVLKINDDTSDKVGGEPENCLRDINIEKCNSNSQVTETKNDVQKIKNMKRNVIQKSKIPVRIKNSPNFI